MSWVERRVEHLASEKRMTVDPRSFGDDLVEHYSIPALDATGLPETQSASEIESAKQLLTGGEVMLSRLNPRKARVVRVPRLGEVRAVASGEFVVLRPDSVEPRFLEYLLRSESVRQSLDGSVQSVTRSHQRIRPEQLMKLNVRVPKGLAEQRAIADFLDVETARIDALIAKKRRLITLLEEHLDGRRSAILWGDSPQVTPLAHLVQADRKIMYGIVLPGPDVEDGVPIVKGGDVAKGLSRRLSRTTREIEGGYARSRLRSDDLVFAIRGGVGDVGIVEQAAAGANITQDVARVAPAPGVLPRWLLHVLRSRELQAEAAREMTGATIRGLNIWSLKRLTVPVRSTELQARQLAELEALAGIADGSRTRLERQISLLQEKRQALITAAVTGELEIPGVAA